LRDWKLEVSSINYYWDTQENYKCKAMSFFKEKKNKHIPMKTTTEVSAI